MKHFLIGLLLASVASAAFCNAANPWHAADGQRWERVGYTVEDKRPVSVDLTLDHGKTVTGILRYGLPRACAVRLTLQRETADVREFAASAFGLKSAFCEAITSVTVQAKAESVVVLTPVSRQPQQDAAVELAPPAHFTESQHFGTLLGVWNTVGAKGANGQMRINKVIPGTEAAVLSYGQPLNCELMAEYSGWHDSRHHFTVAKAAGGACRAMVGSRVTLAPRQSVAVEVIDSKGAVGAREIMERGPDKKP